MANLLGVAIGFLFTFVTGHFTVARFLKWLRNGFEVPELSSNREIRSAWRKLREHPERSGSWVGRAERVIFFFALYLNAWQIVGIWMAFKLAAKWEARNHAGYVPENPGEGVAPLEWAAARRVWAAQEYATFVVGTAANLLLAGAGAWMARILPNVGGY